MTLPRTQTILYANSSFCLFSTLLVLLFSREVADHVITLPRAVFLVLAIPLLLFALGVFITARMETPSRSRVMMIFVADLAWVVLTPVLMVTLGERITGLGQLLLSGIALVVAVFAAVEWLAIRRMQVGQ